MMFQSTPDLVNRENQSAGGGGSAAAVFQSTPDLVNRENTDVYIGCFLNGVVSIHSRFS